MCGIVGSYQVDSEIYKRPLESDLLSLRHRGPDGSGLYADSQVRLGHTRLAIIELSKSADQPMVSRDGRFVVVYNGEIYNYPELRQALALSNDVTSDTEVLIEAYRRWGTNCLQELVGMFAFAIWDRQREELFLARDRLGEKPLYYTHHQGSLLFASELKSILGLINEKFEIDAESVDCFLHYQFVPEPRTLVSGILKLPPGHFAIVNKYQRQVEPIQYWSIEEMHRVANTEANEAQNLDLAIQDAVRLCLRSDVPVGVALSGGIDSSIIAAMAQHLSDRPLHAFCIGYPDRPQFDERNKAKELAEKLGMIFHEIEIPVDTFVDSFPNLIRAMDEPIADPAAFAHFSIPKAVSEQGIKVLLSGLGSDEIFWGYDWVRKSVIQNMTTGRVKKHPKTESTLRAIAVEILKHKLVRGRLANFAQIKIDGWFPSPDEYTPPSQISFYINEPQFRQAFKLKRQLYGNYMKDVSVESLFRCTEIGSRTTEQIPLAQMRMLIDTWFTSNCLTLSDRVNMAFGVETRLPFANHRLIETVLRRREVLPDYTMGNKSMLRQGVANWLPKEITKRRKAGFQPPVNEWLKAVVEKYSVLIDDGVLRQHGIVHDEVDQKYIIEFSNGGWHNLFYSYKIVLLEVWMREVFEKKPVNIP